MTEFIIGLFLWVCAQMGVNPGTVEFPPISAVDPQEMSLVVCGVVDPKCPIAPAVYDGETLYIIQGLDFAGNKEYASFIVHHLVHVVQFAQAGKNPSVMIQDMDKKEAQALDIQKRYLSLIRTDSDLK